MRVTDVAEGRGRHCSASNAAGEPCGQTSTVGASGLCIFHDPARAKEAAAARRRGLERSREVVLDRAAREPVAETDPVPALEQTLAGVARYQAWVIVALASGKLEAKTAGSLTYGLGNLKALLEKRDLEDALKEARSEVAALQKRLGGKAA
jgi:hypothetical protein